MEYIGRKPGPRDSWSSSLVLRPLSRAYAGVVPMNVDTLVKTLGKMVMEAVIRPSTHEADGGEDVAIRLLIPMASRPTSEASGNAVRVRAFHSKHISHRPVAQPV